MTAQPPGPFSLDPDITFLNHGSFGSSPRSVLEAQDHWRGMFAANPVRFVTELLQPAIERARARLAEFVGADPDGVVFVPNATTGVNAVLRSLEPQLGPGDELLTISHAYNACRNAMEVTALRTGARMVVVEAPFPVDDPGQVQDAVLAAVGPRTRLLMVDHITSPTALVMPVESLVAALEPGVPVLIDGAHAPGMVPLSLSHLGASFYTGNCHKWLCAPPGAGFLHVRADHRDDVLPVTISHGWNAPPDDRSRFHHLFDYTGTSDFSPWLVIPEAIDEVGALSSEGWPGLMASNRALALEARSILCQALEAEAPAPESMIGSMASVVMSAGEGPPPGMVDPLSTRLRDQYSIEVPVFVFPQWPQRLIRISAQWYNRRQQYERLAEVLRIELDLAG